MGSATGALLSLLFLIIGTGLVTGGLVGGFFVYIWWQRWKDRELRSLKYVLLQIRVPKDNEVKVDAMEQILSSLSSLKKVSGVFSTEPPEHVSLEIVGRYGDITFYISVPEHLQDLVEKQIHSAYTGADVRSVDEYSIFTEEGEVAWAQFGLKEPSFHPMKSYKDLPIDTMSGITSALAKMGQTEAAAIQILITGYDTGWKKAGRAFIAETKKKEADPEKASYKVDAKNLEAIENKINKSGFLTTIRIVVVSDTQEKAKQHLSNIQSTFEQ